MEVEEDIKKVRVYDVECLYDFFCVNFTDRDSDEKHKFRIWREANQVEEMREFVMTRCSGLVGFNNLNYDWPILNYICLNHRRFSRLRGDEVAKLINEFSQKILTQKWSAVRNPLIYQLDLFKLHHFDNKNKAVSLKALQIAMNWPLVADMPVDHREYAKDETWALSVEEYNENDVLSTKHFLSLSSQDIALRKRMEEVYGLDLINTNESKMGELIIMSQVAKHMGVPMGVLKGVNTKRDEVRIADVMLPITFETPEFRKAQAAFSKKIVDTRIKEESEKETKPEGDDELYSCILDGVQYDFGLGGIHGLRGPGKYVADNNHLIFSADVSSYYPNLGIRNRWRPEHLGDSFCAAYEGGYKERKKYPKGSLEDKGVKKALVSVFGKSISQYSPLYDPKYFYSIVVNGQLLLARLAEMLTLNSSAHVIMANTDGVEIELPAEEQELVESIFRQWELATSLVLEYKRYSRLFIRDVNNYIGEKTDGTSYNKGAYEHTGVEWHKDHSMLCVPYAAQEYLLHGTPILQSLAGSPVESFFIGKRAKSGGRFMVRYVTSEGEIREVKWGRTFRYFIGKQGGYLFKKEENAKKASKLDAPWKVVTAMDMRGQNFESLRPLIDYRYYEQETRRLLAPILQTQTTFA